MIETYDREFGMTDSSVGAAASLAGSMATDRQLWPPSKAHDTRVMMVASVRYLSAPHWQTGYRE